MREPLFPPAGLSLAPPYPLEGSALEWPAVAPAPSGHGLEPVEVGLGSDWRSINDRPFTRYAVTRVWSVCLKNNVR